jgi:small subunit ribosomal protein S8
MNMTDPIADMLTRTRNATAARHAFMLVPASKMKLAIARILKEEGYVNDFELVKSEPAKGKDVATRQDIRIWLKYAGGKESVITGLDRVSKPGLRVYAGKDTLPRVMGGLGIAIISTSKGIMTEQKARRMGLGGEVLCRIW